MPKAGARFRRVFWPTYETPDQAMLSARGAASFVLTMAVIVGGVATLNLAGITNHALDLGASAYFAALVLLVLSFFLFKMSRVAAILTLVVYVGERGLQLSSGQAQGQGLLTIVLGWFFLNAVRGTFAYRRFTAKVADSGRVRTEP